MKKNIINFVLENASLTKLKRLEKCFDDVRKSPGKGEIKLEYNEIGLFDISKISTNNKIICAIENINCGHMLSTFDLVDSQSLFKNISIIGEENINNFIQNTKKTLKINPADLSDFVIDEDDNHVEPTQYMIEFEVDLKKKTINGASCEIQLLPDIV